MEQLEPLQAFRADVFCSHEHGAVPAHLLESGKKRGITPIYYGAGDAKHAMRAVRHQVATTRRLPTTTVVAIPVHRLGGRVSAPGAHILHCLGDHLCSCRCGTDYSLIVGLKSKSLKGKARPQIRIEVPLYEEKAPKYLSIVCKHT